MTAITIALLGFGLLMLLLFIGVRGAFSILMSGVVGIWMTVGFGPIAGVLAHTPYEHMASHTLFSVPLFIQMAELLARDGSRQTSSTYPTASWGTCAAASPMPRSRAACFNAFLVAGVIRMPVSEVFKGIWPFVVTESVVLALLVMLPQLALWFPAFIYG